MHQHPNFEIHYIEEGRFSLDYDDKSVTLFKDTLVIIPPKCYHRFEGEGENLKRISFQFKLLKLKRGANLYDGYTELFSSLSAPMITHRFIGELVKIGSVMGVISGDEELCRLNAYFTLAFLKICDIIREGAKTELKENNLRSAVMSQSDEEYTLIRIFEFMRTSCGRHVTLSELSNFVSLSERQVQRILSARMGEGFRAILSKERITLAKSIITSTEVEERALEEIAYECGYTNYVSFWSQFKKETGYSPKEYRKAFKNETLTKKEGVKHEKADS
jgi:AraC-like DNA-binding protein